MDVIPEGTVDTDNNYSVGVINKKKSESGTLMVPAITILIKSIFAVHAFITVKYDTIQR